MTQNENIFKALGLFIESIRPYIVSKLLPQAGERWPHWYYESLGPKQKNDWDLNIRNGTAPQNLIDFGNLKGFALHREYKELLRDDFGTKARNLPTWFEEIADVRHKCQHFQELDAEELSRAYSNMIVITKQLNMTEIQQALTALRDGKPEKPSGTTGPLTSEQANPTLVPWFKNVTPHMDIRQGTLDESIFAANLAEVAVGSGREIYRNPTVFFSKTYFTAGLKTVARRVIQGLNGGTDSENRVISLQTGFGGGKTHTLISLYHIAHGGEKALTSTQEWSSYTGKPNFEKANIAVFTNTTNDPTQGRQVDGLHIRALWGELAYQLGQEKAYNQIRANDENRTAPKGLFKAVLEQCKPALILIDELADYCVAAAGVTVGASFLSDQTISFMQELSEAISQVDQCVLVVTLPASATEIANSQQAVQILSSLSSRLSRVDSDTKPVADDEIYQVIRSRLFEDLGKQAYRENVLSAYASLYQQLAMSGEIPAHVATSEYREKLNKAYPFHPELIDMFKERWASNHNFQRTRGVLRLLASIIADLWKRQGSLIGINALIHTADVNFENLDALSGQLKKLYGNGYDAVISADVSGASSNAFRIDSEKREYGDYNLTQGIAATILLGSFGSVGANKGIGVEEMKLCVLEPESFNHNSVNGALDALESNAHYLYYSATGASSKRYWFHTKPNINILINQANAEIKKEDVHAEILKRINHSINRIEGLTVLVNPADDIPEKTKPTLIILGPQYQANTNEVSGQTKTWIEKIATKKGNHERVYRNTLLFLLASDMGMASLSNDLRNYLACVKIRDEYASQLETDQKEDIRRKIVDYDKQSIQSLVTTYSVLVKYSASQGIRTLPIKQFRDNLETQINNPVLQTLKDEQLLLESVGLGLLRNHNLLPTVELPIKTKDVYEAFLRYDDKPLITGPLAIQNSLLRYCNNGEFAIASGDGSRFTSIYYQEKVPLFDVNDDTYWLVDKSLYTKPEPIPANPKSEVPENGSSPTSMVDINPQSQNNPTPSLPVSTQQSKSFKSITISGKVDVANYSQIFSSFVNPLVANQVEIEIRIKGKSTQSNPITETSSQYQITKESAKQLGLRLEVEE